MKDGKKKIYFIKFYLFKKSNKIIKNKRYADKIIAVENNKNIIQHSGSGNAKPHNNELHNSFVSPMVRKNC